MSIEIILQIAVLHQFHHHVRWTNPWTDTIQLNDMVTLKLSAKAKKFSDIEGQVDLTSWSTLLVRDRSDAWFEAAKCKSRTVMKKERSTSERIYFHSTGFVGAIRQSQYTLIDLAKVTLSDQFIQCHRVFVDLPLIWCVQFWKSNIISIKWERVFNWP